MRQIFLHTVKKIDKLLPKAGWATPANHPNCQSIQLINGIWPPPAPMAWGLLNIRVAGDLRPKGAGASTTRMRQAERGKKRWALEIKPIHVDLPNTLKGIFSIHINN
jgi:hypothetical protein